VVQPIEPILWPLARPRFDLAKRTGDRLLESVADWQRSQPLRAQIVLSDDTMGFELRFEGFVPPAPLDEWGVAFAAVVHQYRVILDNAIEQLARELQLKKDRRRHFPITQNRQSWEREATHLAGLPPRIVDLVLAAQPFVHTRSGVDPRDHVLSILAWTDNQDKHDQLLVMDFIIDRVRVAAFAEMQDSEVVFEDVAVVVEHPQFKVGAPLVSVRTDPHKIASLERADVWLYPALAALDWAGRRTPVVLMSRTKWCCTRSSR
jgi:hypothetical protein